MVFEAQQLLKGQGDVMYYTIQPTVVKIVCSFIRQSLLAGSVCHSDFVVPLITTASHSGFSSSQARARAGSPRWLLSWQEVLLSFLPLVALRGCRSLHSSLRTRESKPETQGVVPPVLRVRPGLGLALSNGVPDIEAPSLGSSSGVSGSGPTGARGLYDCSSLLAGWAGGSPSSLATWLVMGPAKRLLTIALGDSSPFTPTYALV